jgi:hypothetical protein
MAGTRKRMPVSAMNLPPRAGPITHLSAVHRMLLRQPLKSATGTRTCLGTSWLEVDLREALDLLRLLQSLKALLLT